VKWVLRRGIGQSRGVNESARTLFGPHSTGDSRYTFTVHHETSLIAAFVKRGKRDRYREIVSNSRLRHKFTDQLAHFKDFDPQYAFQSDNKLFADNIARELDKRHSPKIVFAISEIRRSIRRKFRLFKHWSRLWAAEWAPSSRAYQDARIRGDRRRTFHS